MLAAAAVLRTEVRFSYGRLCCQRYARKISNVHRYIVNAPSLLAPSLLAASHLDPSLLDPSLLDPSLLAASHLLASLVAVPKEP